VENSNHNRKTQNSVLKPNNVTQRSKVLFLKKILFELVHIKKLKILPRVLDNKEMAIVKILVCLIIVAFVGLLTNWYFKNSTLVPSAGGEYIEGIIGSPSLINPILAQTNEVDRDITKLLFNGLLKQQGSKLIPDLSLSYSISTDQLTYTFKLRPDVKWHDGAPLNSDDVVFTVERIQDPEFKSPLYNSLSSVLIQKIDDYTIKFKLTEPFSPFLSLLTFGILPKHIWENIPAATAHLADFNLKTPIGTGPFKIKSFKKDSRGVIKSYTLKRNNEFYNQPPYIQTITFKFYPDFSSAVLALNNNNIDGINYLPNKYQHDITNKDVVVMSLSLPQYSAIFFNQEKNPLLKKKEIRKALTLGINRREIIQKALDNEGEIIYGPILPGFIGYDPNIKKYEFNPGEAENLISQAGWKKITPVEYQELIKLISEKQLEISDETAINSEPPLASSGALVDVSPITQDFFWQKNKDILSLTLTTVDNPETSKAASVVKKQWEKIGIKVDLDILPKEELLEQVIKPRDYEALLFGQIVGQDPDPYAFWHSSQIKDPGVNLALYVNKKVDTLLEQARKISDPKERAKKYIEFQNILKQDMPAIFLYNPTYPYVLHKRVQNFNITRISIPSDRFNGIEKWYIKTKRKLR
jgi:peptide/nickel transport system substrate-binding protein